MAVVFGARMRPREGGAHVDISVYAGPDADHLARCGMVTMRPDEAAAFAKLLRAVDTREMAAMDALLCVEGPKRPASAVACSHCGAGPGRRCHDGYGITISHTHRARERAAEAAASSAGDCTAPTRGD
jgi:hypothetical protein